MPGVLEWLTVVEEGPRRGLEDRGRGFHGQGLMGPLGVVDSTKGIEASLLSPEVGPRRAGGAFLECAVHAFVAPVLLRFARLDEFGNDAE